MSSKFRKVFEGICARPWPFGSCEFKQEDGGQALIAEILDEVPPNPAGGQMFVRIHSWDETCEHKEARCIEGKRIRVTIEEIDDD